MKLKEIRKKNGQKFIDDLKRVPDVMVWANETVEYFRVTKREVWEMASTEKIKYHLSRTVYRNKREVMVIM